ncbi:hypothetical protein OS493_017143 [Desmophyllum pertusum]|uniref:VWFA domain-containing protein n=1 Tax=Desmophyllum pertusum TaxID=174260 RepID=A0A9W9YCC5_9CNID|nr:hypothetical protein OS493_017143 [Desmophyllum pertusum]
MVSPSYGQQVAPLRGRPTIFGNVYEKNVVFLLDTSGSMYHSFDVVKEHLLEILFARAISGRDTMFNIIEFNEEVNKWADRLVACTPRTVSIASDWIHKLKCGTSTNTMEALIEAYGDDGMDAIYLVTDGLPDQSPPVILENVRRLHKGRPIHAVYLTGTHSDPAANEFLEDLAKITKGSFHTISLTLYGRIQRVTPVFNQKTEFMRHYDGEFLSPNLTNVFTTNSTLDRPTSAPPASGFVPRMYDPGTPVTLLRAPHGAVPIPYVSWSKYEQERGTSKVLQYADAVLASRGLSIKDNEKSTSSSNVPVAASIMKGMKMLARKDSDGLFYMAAIKEQGENDKFVVEFDQCPALRKPHLQEVALFDMIAYKDAIRHHVCIGDKVLAPWQNDGRYGPGTVLDGVDRRDLQPQGYEGGNILVAFYNGQTEQLSPGVAVRIPLAVFDRIVTELQLPESQRRKIRLAADTSTPPYQGRPPPLHTTWQRPFSPPRQPKQATFKHDSKEALSDKIKSQLERNRHLLDRVQFDEEGPEAEEILSDADTEEVVNMNDRNGYETFDVCVGTEDLDFKRYVAPVMPVGTPLSKAGGKPETKKRWRWWSSGVPPRPPRFRETALAKPAEVRDDKNQRPGYQEYQSMAGVPFPSGTDKKFQDGEWHPHHQWKNTGKAVARSGPPQLRHHEYQSSKGVPFPPATDNKFNTASDGNWQPEHANESVQRSSNWEDGLGRGDVEKNRKERKRLEIKKDANERYHTQIAKDSTEKQQKERARQDYHRKMVGERTRQISEQSAEKARQDGERMESKRQSSDKICEKERARQDKADTWKHSRIEAMKERRTQHDEMENSYERAAQEHESQRLSGLKDREQRRADTHHDRLVTERRVGLDREEQLKQREVDRQTRIEKTKHTAERRKDMRIHVKQQNEQKYRASILP